MTCWDGMNVMTGPVVSRFKEVVKGWCGSGHALRVRVGSWSGSVNAKRFKSQRS